MPSEERRKNKRMELSGSINVTQLGGEHGGRMSRIEIEDVSRDGIGFNCGEPLTLGYTYEAYLTIWTMEQIHVFLKIVRGLQREDDSFNYGAVFIGMPEIDSDRIVAYETVHDYVNREEQK